MREVETALFVIAFLSELTAAWLVLFEIRANRDLRSETLSRPAPMSAALDQVAGILTVFDKRNMTFLESVESQKRVVKLQGAIRRQSWAFAMLVFGAMAAVAANLLTVWAR